MSGQPGRMNKKRLSERDICTKFITPALRQAGWNEITQLREEVSFTNVNGTKLKNMLIPVPPREEQLGIVAKVNELMAVCDQLEAQLAARTTVSSRLLESLLHEALEHPDGTHGYKT